MGFVSNNLAAKGMTQLENQTRFAKHTFKILARLSKGYLEQLQHQKSSHRKPARSDKCSSLLLGPALPHHPSPCLALSILPLLAPSSTPVLLWLMQLSLLSVTSRPRLDYSRKIYHTYCCVRTLHFWHSPPPLPINPGRRW